MGRIFVIVFFCTIACRSHCFGQAVFFYEYKAYTNEEQTDTIHCLLMLLAERDGNSLARLIAIKQLPEGGTTEARYTCTLVDSVMQGLGRPVQSGEKWLHVQNMQLLEGDENLRVPVPAFLFKLQISGEGKYYEPSTIMACLDLQNWYKPIIITQRALAMADLTEEVVAPFFNSTEPYYASLLKLETRSFGSANRNITLHLIVAVNTLDSSIGESCKMDLMNIKTNFRQIARELGVNFVIREFWGKAFSKANVLNALEKLRPGQRDIVVFYFSGHGFRYSGEDNINYPQMSFRISHRQNRDDNGMNLMAVLNLLNSKPTPARLNLVISDCCNEDFGAVRPQGRDVLRTRSLPIRPNIDNLRTLFLPPRSSNIIVSAADRNQLAS
ncbi:MAG: caspase family protein, partial [Chitinophagaceae bacterium]|nr:caspase family protein [Chitinophagaceae bacterium]